jgi:hypothetical protein
MTDSAAPGEGCRRGHGCRLVRLGVADAPAKLADYDFARLCLGKGAAYQFTETPTQSVRAFNPSFQPGPF